MTPLVWGQRPEHRALRQSDFDLEGSFVPKDFFKTSSFKVLMIAVVVLLGLIIYTATAGGSVLANMLGFVSSPCRVSVPRRQGR